VLLAIIACRQPFGVVIIASMTTADQTPDGFGRCDGGTLHSERHDEGEVFEFDDRPLGYQLASIGCSEKFTPGNRPGQFAPKLGYAPLLDSADKSFRRS
jgi:hypothetical protein